MSKLYLSLLSLGALSTVALVVSNSMGLDWPLKTSHSNTIVSTQLPKGQANQAQKKGVNGNLHAFANTGLAQQIDATTTNKKPDGEGSPAPIQGTQDTTQSSSNSNTQNNTVDTLATNPSPTLAPNSSNNDTTATPTPTQAVLEPIDTTNQTSNTNNNQNTQASTDPNTGVTINTGGLPISLGL